MYFIEGQVATLTTSRINDGLWHRIEIVWLAGGGVRLSLDYEKRAVTKMLNAKVQGLYMGKITLGNLEDSEIDSVKIIPFHGCIQVRIFYLLSNNVKRTEYVPVTCYYCVNIFFVF